MAMIMPEFQVGESVAVSQGGRGDPGGSANKGNVNAGR